MEIKMDKYFAILSGEFTCLGEFESFEDAEIYAETEYGEVDWLIDGVEARRWKKVLEAELDNLQGDGNGISRH